MASWGGVWEGEYAPPQSGRGLGKGFAPPQKLKKYKLKLPIVRDFCEQIDRSITDDVIYKDVNKIATEYNKVVNHDKN